MRKYKPQKFGLNPKWVEKYITKPLLKITVCAIVIFIAYSIFQSYANYKAIEQEETRIIAESISAEESIIAESMRAKEQARIEEEAKKESLARIEVETRRTNTLYENQVSKKVCPIGTYLRNDKTHKVGRVIKHYGLEIITNNDWQFTLDPEKTELPKNISMIGYAEYARTLKKQKEAEEKKNRVENASKIQKLLDEELKQQTEITRAKFGNLNHFKLGSKYYRVMKIVGTEVICLEHKKRDKKSNYERIEYSDQMIPIDYITYETEGQNVSNK